MILLQILDEGSITDSQGRKVDFKNTIICLTSNLGSDILADPDSTLPDGTISPSAHASVLSTVSAHFPPELINRLDSLTVFNKLSRPAILEVVDLRLRDVAERLARERRVRMEVGEEARRRRVWPPETRRVRKGKVGREEGGEVRKGVSAWACWGERVSF